MVLHHLDCFLLIIQYYLLMFHLTISNHCADFIPFVHHLLRYLLIVICFLTIHRVIRFLYFIVIKYRCLDCCVSHLHWFLLLMDAHQLLFRLIVYHPLTCYRLYAHFPITLQLQLLPVLLLVLLHRSPMASPRARFKRHDLLVQRFRLWVFHVHLVINVPRSEHLAVRRLS